MASYDAFSKELHKWVSSPDVRKRIRASIEQWGTSHRDRPMPFPMCRERRANNETEKLVLLAAAYHALCRTAEPIIPMVYDLINRDEQFRRFHVLVGYLENHFDEVLSDLQICLADIQRQITPQKPTGKTRKRERRAGLADALNRELMELIKGEQNRIRSYRNSHREPTPPRGITQKELAKRVKATESSVSRTIKQYSVLKQLMQRFDSVDAMMED